jgi:hypothetical protein
MRAWILVCGKKAMCALLCVLKILRGSTYMCCSGSFWVKREEYCLTNAVYVYCAISMVVLIREHWWSSYKSSAEKLTAGSAMFETLYGRTAMQNTILWCKTASRPVPTIVGILGTFARFERLVGRVLSEPTYLWSSKVHPAQPQALKVKKSRRLDEVGRCRWLPLVDCRGVLAAKHASAERRCSPQNAEHHRLANNIRAGQCLKSTSRMERLNNTDTRIQQEAVEREMPQRNLRAPAPNTL